MSHPSPSDVAERGSRPPPETEVDPETERTDDGEVRALWLDSDDAGELISSLSSETARSILTRLHEEPATASELAASVDTSVQNVRHHLDNLQESGLVGVSGTRYSSKGREMDIYAPADEPLVVFVGREDEGTGFVDSLKRFLGAIALLGAASLLVQWLVVSRFSAEGGAGISRVPESLAGEVTVPLGMPPGMLFFAGGALVLAVVSVWRYWYRNHAGA